MTAKGLLNTLDAFAAKAQLSLTGERPGLSIFLFHGIFEDDSAPDNSPIFPQERMTVQLFRQFVDYFSNLGYNFLSPGQLTTEELDARENYALITFDDGYYNNTFILDVLKEYSAPALIFISTAYLREQKSFWSDVLYRERKKRGATDDQILQEIIGLKHKKVTEIFRQLETSFGQQSIKPIDDTDRPLTPSELTELARHPYVYIGNHTHQHEVLTNLTPEEVRAEIAISQQLLEEWIGYTPDWISYPNGSYNDTVLSVSEHAGFKAGITTVQQKNKVWQPKTGGREALLLSRFNPVAINGHIDYTRLRASFQLKTRLKQWLQ